MPKQRLYSSTQIRSLEKRFANVDPPMMERAGRAAANKAASFLADSTEPVLVLAGPGNNGGDGLVLARCLREAGREVCVVCVADPARLPPDAAAAHEAWRRAGGEILAAIPEAKWALVVDAIFGIGVSRAPTGIYADWIAWCANQPAPVLALDVPSGLDADTGRVLGAAVRAQHTLGFIAHKPGLFTLEGPEHAGEISLADLDLPIPQEEDAAVGELLAVESLASVLRPRPRNSHKGSWGEVGILGGSAGMLGAVLLAARAALMLGAGKVFAACLDPHAPGHDLVHPEIMFRPTQELAALASVIAIGPGLGQGEAARALLAAVGDFDGALVCDADALNLLAQDAELAERLARRAGDTVLTPHPAEAGRMLACPTRDVQADRVGACRELARRFGAHVVLKGAGSVIADPDGAWAINPSGNAGLASAGTGDVLTGMVASLLAQGWPADLALRGAVHLHGAAADALVASGEGPIGLTASEIAPMARRLINRWVDAAGH
ncbi:NAD(P)H-hydrate dehydratase [Niveibacterium sp. SC-1]|uniref:NAD(P)H-hydrate dehydratase n=1 Tax=Niveibacterium sp. SC-1 TaxID=3135646 RepID=UPI003120510A